MTFADSTPASQRSSLDARSVTGESRGEATPPRVAMRGSASKNVAVVALALLLAGLGIYNVVLKATWTMLDDGVFWEPGPEGLRAGQVAPGGPGSLAGVKLGDILLALDGADVLTPEQ